jgi:sialate O-acetylesterase
MYNMNCLAYRIIILLGICFCATVIGVQGVAIQFSNTFGDHMVLQRAPYIAKIWGTLTGETPALTTPSYVSVMLFKTSSYVKRKPTQVVNASINSSGEWIASLPSSVKGSSAQTYIITAQLLSQSHTSSIVVIKDVIFGDVFVASGQSNMAFLLKNAFNGSELVQDANNYPNIRLFTSKKIASKTPLNQQPEVEEKWSVGSNISVVMQNRMVEDDNWLYMSALAWTFARRLYQKNGIPIGILNTNWGGTPIEFWMSEEAINACPNPPNSTSVSNSQSPSQGWNGMIVPLLRTTIRGVIWFQGENNSCEKNGALLYKCYFPQMISDWRKRFLSSFEYFGFVQLASYISNCDVPGIRWAQTANFGYVPNDLMPNTYMSLAIDLGDKTSPYGSVHSRHKLELGTRLGNQALNAIYGIKIENGKRPVLAYVERRKEDTTSFFLTFSNAKGVQVRNATVGWEICDDDGIKCVSGTVTSVNRTTVLLKSNSAAPTSSKRTLIRYLWSSYACEYLGCSLYGPGSASDALPVGPFKISVEHTSRNTHIRI